MKRVEFKHVLMLVAVAAMVITIAGCPKAPAPDETIPENMLPEGAANTPVDTTADSGPTVAVPDSVSTLGEAMPAFDMPSSFEMTVDAGDGETETLMMKMNGSEAVAFKAVTDEGVVLISMADKAMYMYDPEKNEGMKMPMDDGEDADMPNPYDFYSEDLKVSGSETIDGVDCWVVEGMEDEEAPGKAWIGKADGLMRQAEDGDDLIKFTYTRINEIPDSEFELPEGIDMQDMGAMMEGMGEMPDDAGDGAPQ